METKGNSNGLDDRDETCIGLTRVHICGSSTPQLTLCRVECPRKPEINRKNEHVKVSTRRVMVEIPSSSVMMCTGSKQAFLGPEGGRAPSLRPKSASYVTGSLCLP